MIDKKLNTAPKTQYKHLTLISMIYITSIMILD